LIPDSREGDTEKSEYVIIKENQVGAFGGQARYFAIFALTTRA